VPHFPAGACECGAALQDAADLGVAASHQVVDIPLESATVTQHDLHEVACRCGRVRRAAAPAGTGAPGTVTYGLGLQAWWVYLVAVHAIPVHRCAELIEALTGAEPSSGFVHSMIERAAAAVAGANKAIRCLIILAHVTCYFLGDRSMDTFDGFVFPDLSGVIVHDRYHNYDKIPGVIHPRGCCRRGPAAVPPRRPGRPVGSPPRPWREQEAAAGPAAAGMPARPRARRPPVPFRPADTLHIQRRRTRPAAR